MNKHPDPEMYHPTISYDVVKETRTLGYAIDPEWSFADSYDFVPGGDPENCVIESLPRGTPLQGLRNLLPPAVWEHARAHPRRVRTRFVGNAHARRQLFAVRAVSGPDLERPGAFLDASTSRAVTRTGTVAPSLGHFVIVISRDEPAHNESRVNLTMDSLVSGGAVDAFAGSWLEPTAGLHGALCDGCVFHDCVVIRGQFRLAFYRGDVRELTGAAAARVSHTDLPPMLAHPCDQRTHPVLCRVQDVVIRTAIPAR